MNERDAKALSEYIENAKKENDAADLAKYGRIVSLDELYRGCKAVYKCRMCGSTHEVQVPSPWKALSGLAAQAFNPHETPPCVLSAGGIDITSIHRCMEGQFGISDLQGITGYGYKGIDDAQC